MSSRTWINLALFALVAGLGLLVILLPRIDQAPPPVTLLDPESPTDITRIRLQVGEGPAVVLRRSADKAWRMEEPYRLDVDASRVAAVLRLAKAESYSRYPLDQHDLTKFQLDPPKMRVWLDKLELRFGATDPLKGRRYVLAGETLHLVDNLNYSDIRNAVEQLLRKPESKEQDGDGYDDGQPGTALKPTPNTAP